MDERFAGVDERFAGVDERFAGVDERFAGMDERSKQIETEVRHTRVLVEGLNSNIRLLAEAVIGTNERIDFFRADTTAGFEEIKGRVGMIQETLVPRVKTLENKVEQETRDVLDVIREKFGVRQAP
jgi:archaellum component FlaC